jgi:hypothetical protein
MPNPVSGADAVNNQIDYGGGLNAQSAPHLLAPGEVQLSTNIDFSLEWGALTCRRGSIQVGTCSTNATGPITLITRCYNGTQSSLDNSVWYAVGTDGFYRGSGSNSISFTQIPGIWNSGNFINAPSWGYSYRGWEYLTNGSFGIRDNGTNAFSWLLPSPPQPYALVGTQGTYPHQTSLAGGQAPFSISSGAGGFSGTWTGSSGVGTFVHAGGVPILSTFTNVEITTTTVGTTTSTDNGIIALATVIGAQTIGAQTVQNTDFNQPWINPIPNPGGTVFGAASTVVTSIGPFGVDYLPIGFSNPSAVQAISVDYSIGDTTFTNYWHAQTTIGLIQSAAPDPIAQLLSQDSNQSFTGYTNSQQLLVNVADVSNALSLIQNIPGSQVMTWAIPRTSYQLIGNIGGTPAAPITNGWSNIQAIRLSIQTSDATAMVIGTPKTYGGLSGCITDIVRGITWYSTWAITTNISGVGTIITAESSPSLPSEATGTATDTNGVLLQYSRAVLSLGSVGDWTAAKLAGADHVVVYRAGGYLGDAYQVDIAPLPSGGVDSVVFNDYAYPDTQIVANSTMTRSLWNSWPTTGVNAVSEPFQDRVFIASGNQVYWSYPGNPLAIEATSGATVSQSGDPVVALIPWGNLEIVNNASVYEMSGSIWEGVNQDWTLRQTGCKRGCAAPKTCIKTPYGIFLFGVDGASLYYPGYGVDTPLDWVYQKIGDLWRGTGTNSPAIQKGRIPALNIAAIQNSCAIYVDHRIYLAVPTNTTTQGCDTIFVLDLSKSAIWMYQNFGYYITSLFWDYVGNRLMAGTTTGQIIQLDTGQTDLGNPIPWHVRTRAWSTNRTMVVENLNIEAQVGTGTIGAKSIVDGTATTLLGTYTTGIKQWYTSPMLGTVANNFALDFYGLQSGTGPQQAIYQTTWDALIQPAKVQYWRTGFDEGGGKTEKIWDVHYSELSIQGTGTVTCVTFVDNVAVMTNTFIGPTIVSQEPFPFPYGTQTGTMSGSGPILFPQAFPNETYGNTVYSTYGVGTFSNITFQIYNDYNIARQEPSRVAQFVSDRFQPHNLAWWKSDMEGWYHDFLTEINPLNGTVTATVMLDGTAIGTYSMTGTRREGYNFALPSETYGNVAWTIYNASAGGVFKHYQTYYNFVPEPTRALLFETPLITLPSETYVKTWLADINPLNGTTTGTLFLDGVAVSTQTMTGTVRHIYEFGMPNVTVAKTCHAVFSSTTPFKYWEREKTAFEFEPKPFDKLTWLVTYKKLGGVTQLDLARYYAMDLEGPMNATITNTWIIDGTAFTTNTFTLSATNIGEGTGLARIYNDQIPFPPGGRGYLFQQQMTSTSGFKVWRSNIDIDRVGIKGLSRVTLSGTPQGMEGGRG